MDFTKQQIGTLINQVNEEVSGAEKGPCDYVDYRIFQSKGHSCADCVDGPKMCKTPPAWSRTYKWVESPVCAAWRSKADKIIKLPATKDGKKLAITMTAKIADGVPEWRTRAGLVMIAIGAAIMGVRIERD